MGSSLGSVRQTSPAHLMETWDANQVLQYCCRHRDTSRLTGINRMAGIRVVAQRSRHSGDHGNVMDIPEQYRQMRFRVRQYDGTVADEVRLCAGALTNVLSAILGHPLHDFTNGCEVHCEQEVNGIGHAAV